MIYFPGRVKTDSAAYNMLGMLLEHQGLFTLSAQAYRRYLTVKCLLLWL